MGVGKAFGGLGDAKLGLNAVGGSSALSVARALGANAKLVTYGSMYIPPPIVMPPFAPANCLCRPALPKPLFDSNPLFVLPVIAETGVDETCVDVLQGPGADLKFPPARSSSRTCHRTAFG